MKAGTCPHPRTLYPISLHQPIRGWKMLRKHKNTILRHVVPLHHSSPKQQPHFFSPPFVDQLIQVDKFDEETGVRGGLGAPTARDVEGTAASTKGTLETTLQQAAAKARCVPFRRAFLLFSSCRIYFRASGSEHSRRTFSGCRYDIPQTMDEERAWACSHLFEVVCTWYVFSMRVSCFPGM